MAAKRETGARRSRAATRPDVPATGAPHARASTSSVAELVAALAAAERRAEKAERQLQLLRDGNVAALGDGDGSSRGDAQAARRNLVVQVAGRPMRLDVIFDSLPLAVYVNDTQGNTLLMNAAAEAQVANFKPPAVPNSVRDIAEHMKPRHRDGRVMEPEEWPFTRILRGEVIDPAHSVDMIMPSATGGVVHHSVSGAPLRDATTGAIIGSIAVVRDVTEQRALARRAHESAREAEAHAAQLEAIFDAITDGVYVYDRDGHLLHRNPAARAFNPLIGQTEYLERPFGERISVFDVRDGAGHPLAASEVPVSRLLRGEVLKGDRSVDNVMRLLDGREVHVNTTGSPVVDAQGVVQGAVIVTRDVTERRRLERRTQEALDALLRVAEALVEVPDATMEPDDADAGASHQYAVAQRLAALTCSVLGCSRVGIQSVDPETLLQRPVAIVGLTPKQERQWWEEQLERPTRLGEGTTTEDTARFLAGETLVIEMSQPPYNALPNPFDIRTLVAAPMRIGDAIVGVLSLDHSGAHHDYTPEELRLTGAVARLGALVVERQRLLGERAGARARVLALEEINRRMNEFLGIAGHEMRTPLTSAKANVQFAERHLRRALAALDGAAEGVVTSAFLHRLLTLFERTELQMNRQQRLIDDLLDASRIQSGKLAMNPQEEDLIPIVRDIVEEQRLLHPGRAVILDLPPDMETIPVFVDQDRIGQVLTNYLNNALKYSPESAPVAVTVELVGGSPRVAVRDAGPGIPAAEQPRVWEPFHRAPGVEVQSGSGVGLGLGLHISKTIVERHYGVVGVESREGAGATFWFSLPLAALG